MSLEIDVRKTVGDFTLNVRISHQSGVTGILGASGSGKSLTLQMIAGVVRPDEGRIVLNGRVLFDSAARIDLPPQARRIGYLFQNYALFPNMTVARNISCGIPRGTERRERKKLVGAWVDNMRLQGLEKHRPGQLSGGQQQRTALARVLIGTPEILMLDEPFSALDSYLREQLVTELKTLLESVDTDAVLVSHSRDEVYELCDTLAVMRDGCVVTAGTVKSVFSDPKTTTAALLTGCKNVVPARPVEDRKMLVPPWGITLTCASPVRPDVDAVGIRAHYFAPDIPSNSYPVQIVQTIEEPFALIHKFRYLSQEATVPPVWWRVSRDRNASVRFPKMLGIAPEDVFLLRDDAGMCRRSGTENPWWSDASANLF